MPSDFNRLAAAPEVPPVHNRRSRRLHAAKQTGRKRRLLFESLESRRVMAADWRNPVDALDVDSDGFLAPVDALIVINDLNSIGARRLVARHDPAAGYLDVDGDQFVAPIDALQVINYLNGNLGSQRRIVETNSLVREADVTITLGQPFGARTYRVQIEAAFDTSDPQAALEDLLAVYLVDPGQPGATLLDRGAPGTALFTLSGTKAEFAPGLVRWDGSILEIDVTSVTEHDTGLLRFQMISGDQDLGSRFTIKPLSNMVDPDGDGRLAFPSQDAPIPAGAAADATNLPAATDVRIDVSNVRFDSTTGRYSAELRLHNDGAPLGRDVAIVFPDLPSGVALRNAAGTTAQGAPYLNAKPAIPPGGLRTGSRSEPILVEFDDPTQAPFVLKPHVLASANRAPAFDPIAAQTAMPGGVLRVPLNATDADGDPIMFSIADGADVPTGELSGSAIVFRPAPGDIGAYSFDVVASDGSAAATRHVSLNVVADPITTTRISGKVLKVNGDPLVGVPVEVGAVQGLTLADGSFTLDLGGGPVVADTIKVRGERFVGAATYPFIAEKLPLMLEHAVYRGFNNVIDRPIYLPELDVAGGTAIDPAHDTTVRQTIRAGETASVSVAAGTLMNQQGTPFVGTLSITEVPPELTPAALPEGLSPDLVVTIQPGEMVFARPAPISLPNRAGRPAGRVLDLWSINPVTGKFEDVGDMQVSADGTSIETISGGVKNSSWHFAADPPIASPQRPVRYNPKQGCGACPNEEPTNSSVELHSGTLTESHDLVAYQSQGQRRGIQLVYDSLRADPRPILHFGVDEIDPMAIFPFEVERLRYSAHLSVTRGEFQMTVPGVEKFIPERGGFGGGSRYSGLPNNSHFWTLPAGEGPVDGALQIDLREQPTGVYRYDLDSGVYFYRYPNPLERVEFPFIGSSSEITDDLLIVNAVDSPFGAGWGIAGWQQIVESANRLSNSDDLDRSAMIVDGDGTELLFKFDATQGKFVAPPGDFSTLEKLSDGAFRRTMPDQTVYQFNSRNQLATTTDRNQNVTTFGYDAQGRLTSITDPVGLVTTFAYAGQRVSTIVDPAGRETKLTYDGAGNLTRVVDPDDTSRTWSYDADHHMTGETDKLGRVEQSVYGYHGRVVSAIRKDGSVVRVDAPETHGLLPPGATADFARPPTMARLTFDAVASYADGNGNVERTSLDGAGQSLGQTDAIGANPIVTRDANNLPAATTNARGFVSSSTFDERGNLLSSRDTLSIRAVDEPGVVGLMSGSLSYFGAEDHYTFQGRKGEQLLVDYVQGVVSTTIRQAGDDGQFVNSSDLPADGTYRVDVRRNAAFPDYVARLLSPAQAPPLPVGVRVDAMAPAGQDFSYRASFLRDQRLRIEDHTPNAARYWQGASLDREQVLALQPTGTPGVLEVVIPADGEYWIAAINLPSDDVSFVPFGFTATVITPSPAIKSGFGVVHAGTLQSNEQAEFPFTAPAGTMVYVDYLGTNPPAFGVTLRDAEGRDVSQQQNIMRLSSSGTFTATIHNFGGTEQAFSFRLIDLTAAPTAAFGETFQDTVADGAAVIRRLSGVAGQRWMALAEFDDPVDVIVFSESDGQPVASFDFFHHDALLELPDTGDYFVIADGLAASRNVVFETIDARAARPIKLDDDLRGTFSAEESRKFYRFTAQPGSTIYLESLNVSFITDIGLLGEYRLGTSGNRFITLPAAANDPATEREYLLIAAMDDPQFLPHPFAFRLHDFHDTTTPITVGQSVAGNLDFSERDAFTFEGKAGQVLFFDDRDYDVVPDSGQNVLLETPPDATVFGYFGGGPVVLSADGVYRLSFTAGASFNAPLHHDYQFRLFDLNETPFASFASPMTQPLVNGAAVAAYRFSAANGQRVTFTQSAPATTSLKIYSAKGTLLKDSELNDSFTMTFTNDETVFILVSGRDESLTGPIASTWTISDASEPAVTPSGFGVFEGQALNDDTLATFQANAGDRVLVQQDETRSSVSLRFIDADGATAGTFGNDSGFGFGAAAQYFVAPRSGSYTIKAVSIQSFAAAYRFQLARVQDLPLAPLNADIPAPKNNHLGHFFRLAGTAGQRIDAQLPLPDSVDETRGPFFGASVRLYDPVANEAIAFGRDEVLPRTGNYVVQFYAENFDGMVGRLTDLATVPTISLDTPVAAARTKVHEVVYLRISATANETRLFQFSSPNWTLVNLNDTSHSIFLQLGARQAPIGGQVYEGVVKFPDSGEYLLVGAGRLADPLDYSATMTRFTESTVELTGGRLSESRTTYDPRFSQVTSHVDEQGGQSLFDVDPANGNIFALTQVVGAVGGGDDLTASFTYTASGQIDTATDPLGRVTDYDYDARGRVVALMSARGTPQQTIVRMEYDAAGNLTAMVDENGRRTEFQYDAMNRRTRMTAADPDDAGPLAAPVTLFSYDAAGNPVSVTDPEGRLSSTMYDDRDRPVASTDPDLNVTRTEYDGNGNVARVVDPLGRAARFVYDARNRLVETIDAAGGRTRYAYDLDNNLTTLTDASGNATRYAYDARGRVVAETDPLGAITRFAYNGANELLSKVDSLGRKIETAYDVVGRVTRERWLDADGTVANEIDYTYDAASRVIRVHDAFSDIVYAYDALDRVTREQTSGADGVPTTILDMTYDAAGNLLTVTDTIAGQAGSTNTFSYDAMNRPIRLVQAGAGVATKRVDFAYNANSQTTSLTRASNTAGTAIVASSTFAYDSRNRISGITHRNSANATLASFTYQIDAASRITQITDIDGTTSYSYDSRNQLTGASVSSANPQSPAPSPESYSYDATGNRISSHIAGADYVTGSGNRLLRDDEFTYEHDAEGNLVQEKAIADGYLREFVWDHRNRLVRVTERAAMNGPALRIVNYIYDALNRRVGESVTDSSGASSATYFVNNGANVLADWTDPDGPGPQPAAESKRYLHGPAVDQVLAQEDAAGNVLWDLADHLGSVRALVDNGGAVVNQIRYDSFGNLVALSSASPEHSTRYQFAGREFDGATGLHYYRARYYNAETGRFISEDPIGFSGGDDNLYRYVGNRPASSSDPSGLEDVTALVPRKQARLPAGLTAADVQGVINEVKGDPTFRSRADSPFSVFGRTAGTARNIRDVSGLILQGKWHFEPALDGYWIKMELDDLAPNDATNLCVGVAGAGQNATKKASGSIRSIDNKHTVVEIVIRGRRFAFDWWQTLDPDNPIIYDADDFAKHTYFESLDRGVAFKDAIRNPACQCPNGSR